MSIKRTYQSYQNTMRKVADVEYSIGVLSWDKETYMPERGAAIRAQQVATLSGIAHEIFTNPKFGKKLHTLVEKSSQLTAEQARNVELSLKSYKRTKCFDKKFVIRSSQAISKAYHAWLEARKANDYRLFQDALGEVVEIKRESAERLGYENHPYNALLEDYEPNCTVAELDTLFEDVKNQLVNFVSKIRQQPQIDNRFLFQHYDKDKQWKFGIELLKNMGYDFTAGRQDISPHPFTINFASSDVRVTTRIDENDFANMTWSCIHEGGHALYEQGLPIEQYGLPLGKAVSLGIHESQSRLWENNVGRSKTYWSAHYDKAQALFPEQLGNISLTDFYKAINTVQPNLIRTESDELHYHFHVLIRYEVEKGLIEGNLSVEELPEFWNQRYKDYLGVDVPDDANGVLQDIHWAHGSLGYFPTYSLGSFYAAQFYAQALKDIPNLETAIAAGNNQPLLNWLRDNVHRYGKQYDAKDLCIKITGEPLQFSYFMDYATKKYADIYSIVL